MAMTYTTAAAQGFKFFLISSTTLSRTQACHFYEELILKIFHLQFVCRNTSVGCVNGS